MTLAMEKISTQEARRASHQDEHAILLECVRWADGQTVSLEIFCGVARGRPQFTPFED
jgi:hypothetical protein